MNDIAAKVDKDVTDQLVQVEKDIAQCNADIAKQNAALVGAGTGIGVSAGIMVGVPGAVAVFCATPIVNVAAIWIIAIAVIVAAICLIISLGFLIDAVVQLGKLADKMVGFETKKSDLLQKQAEIKDMLTDVSDNSNSIDDIATFTIGFSDVWKFIDKQLSELLDLFTKWNGDTKDQPDMINRFSPYFATQMQPYFKSISEVMEAYVVNFP